MADFSINIPDEYLDGSEDFGFTTIDSNEFEEVMYLEEIEQKKEELREVLQLYCRP